MGTAYPSYGRIDKDSGAEKNPPPMSLTTQKEVLRTLCTEAPSVSTQLIAAIGAAIAEAQADANRKPEILQSVYQRVMTMVANQKDRLSECFEHTEKFALFQARHNAMGGDVRSRETIQQEYAATLHEMGLGKGNASDFAKHLAEHDRRFLKANLLVADDALWLDPGDLLAKPTAPVDSILEQAEEVPTKDKTLAELGEVALDDASSTNLLASDDVQQTMRSPDPTAMGPNALHEFGG
ncbi:MAG: hypothetical protein Greene101449_825 [Candidatus Peregrinibacteria bacterium Greene1014_49]|nr:MAG: hypothetical protein Greene101449_825 [Candidatus Peregrinibacteria bacterium Greene1014_49]